MPNTPLIAHFDEKLLPDTDGDLVDRMPIVVSGVNVEKLLAIPKLSVSSGERMGNTVIKKLQDWKDVPDFSLFRYNKLQHRRSHRCHNSHSAGI